MNKHHQTLISELSFSQPLTVTALLSYMDHDSWEANKKLLLCGTPRLTLEMAIKQVAAKEHELVPSPKLIFKALKYAEEKYNQSQLEESYPLAATG